MGMDENGNSRSPLDDIGCTLGLCDPSVPLKQNPLQLIAMSALLWLFAHRISRLCSLIAVSELFDALPHHVLQHLSSLMPSMYCNTQEEIPQSSHILQRLKGGPVHILSLMRGGERGIGPWRHPTLQMRGNYSNFTSMHSTGRMKAVTNFVLNSALLIPPTQKGLCAEISVPKKMFTSYF